MTPIMPAYFISHGGPDIAIRDTAASRFLRQLDVARDARAILVISAHWESDDVAISATAHPETIYDFGGFPQALYEMHYPAKGAPELAVEIADLLAEDYPERRLDGGRGLDHGAWVPLILAEPKARVPVLQLSIMPHQDEAYHYRLGEKLSALRKEGVVILGSGSATHNLRAAFRSRGEPTPNEVIIFNDWLYEHMMKRDDAALMDWQNVPYGLWNHPSNDHILPLFVVLGATQGEVPERIHASYDYSVLSMDSYCFSSAQK